MWMWLNEEMTYFGSLLFILFRIKKARDYLRNYLPVTVVYLFRNFFARNCFKNDLHRVTFVNFFRS